jgi:3-dehydroquinate dehydratase
MRLLMDKIMIINGPNLNMLGIREVAQYGNTSYDDLCSQIEKHSKNKFQI